MLKKLRNKKFAKKIWIALAAIIVPAFVFWGFSGALRGQKGSYYAGRVFNKKITTLEFQDALEAVRIQAILQFGDKLPEIRKYLNLESQAWERIIILEEARKRQISTSDQEVVALIENYPFLQRNGKFDQRTYSDILRYEFNIPERRFEEQTRQNLILSKLYDALTKDISVTEQEVNDGYRKENEQVSIYYIAGLYADFIKETSATEEEIKDYFTKNSLEFKQALSFNLEYVALESEDKTKQLFSRLNKKSNLAQTAKSLGFDIKETGLFAQTDPIPGIGWSPEILNLLSQSNAGVYLPPVHLDKFYYIFRVKERKEPFIPEFSAVKDKAKDALLKVKSKKIAQEKIENCLKGLEAAKATNFKSIDLEKFAKIYRLKFGNTDLFKYGSYIEGIGASDTFWINSLKLKDDGLSPIIATSEGLYVIKVKSHVPIDEKKFASEKEEFSKKILSQKKQEYFNSFSAELKRKAQLF